MRLFIAAFVEFGFFDEIKESLAGCENIRWTKSENLHVTLAFLGETRQEEVADKLKALPIRDCTVRLSSMSIVGKNPSAIVVNVKSKELPAIHENIAKRFAIAQRTFTPHLTLARAKDEALECANKHIFQWCDKEFGIYTLRFWLVQSTLTQNGPIYTRLTEFK